MRCGYAPEPCLRLFGSAYVPVVRKSRRFFSRQIRSVSFSFKGQRNKGRSGTVSEAAYRAVLFLFQSLSRTPIFILFRDSHDVIPLSFP